jgi:hypothetical protein
LGGGAWIGRRIGRSPVTVDTVIGFCGGIMNLPGLRINP